jgi:phospholipase C
MHALVHPQNDGGRGRRGALPRGHRHGGRRYRRTQDDDGNHHDPYHLNEVGHNGQANHEYDLSWFFQALAAGKMPTVSFLKAANYQDGHAGYSDPTDERHFLVKTVNAIMKSPFWANTAIIITYDDSDGWYDHQMPPIVNSSADPSLDALNGPGVCGHGTPLGGFQDRCGYGQRLPFLVLSPFARPNFVSGTTIDQSSVLKFIEDNWLGGQRISTTSFDNLAGSIDNMFTFSHPSATRLILNTKGQVVARWPAAGRPTAPAARRSAYHGDHGFPAYRRAGDRGAGQGQRP